MDELEQYLSEHYWTEDDVLREVRADIERARARRSRSAPRQGACSRCSCGWRARRACSSSGTLFGYSGIWMARELPPGGQLDTVEIEPLHADAAEHWFERAGLADRVTVHRGAGLDVLATLPGPLRRGLHRRRQGRLPGVRAAARSSACGRAAS